MRLGKRSPVQSVGGKILTDATGLANGLCARLTALGIAPEHGHLGAGGGKSIGQRATEHAGGSNDDGDFLGEIKEIRHKWVAPEQRKALHLASALEGLYCAMHPRLITWLEAIIGSAILLFFLAEAV
jgi:hypothetical protein